MTMPAPLDQTAEERALAQRLARLGPHGEPSPRLDAAVLAAARAALDAPPISTHRSRRWPVALGVAASLVLAVGVAWRLRPLPPGSSAELAVPTRPAPQASPAVSAAEPAGAAAPANQAASLPDVAALPDVAVAPPPEPAPRRAAKTAAAPPVPADDVRIDAPAPVTFEAPASAAAAPSSQKAEAAEAAGAATDANEAAQLDRVTTSDAQPETGDEPVDAMPPATADAPGVRDAWLSRIRALIDSGDVTGGRRSLHAFVERYPDYPLPEDLRALQQ